MSTAPKSEAEAISEQERLREQVRIVTLARPPRLVAGVDVAYTADSERIAAAVVVLKLADLSIVESAHAVGESEFPYLPGLLGFREVPILQRAIGQLSHMPDVLACDGYGIAHPRRFGLACHLGVVTGIPSFGVGKTAFVGEYHEPGPARGDRADLTLDGQIVGCVLRTQAAVKPVFVSPGHLIDIDSAAGLTLRLAPDFRLPQTTRLADQAARRLLNPPGIGSL